jgi:hypothetical protein
MVETPLIFHPYMLVVTIVLFVNLLIRFRHSADNTSRIMPNKALEELIAPPNTQLIPLGDMSPFILSRNHYRYAT